MTYVIAVFAAVGTVTVAAVLTGAVIATGRNLVQRRRRKKARRKAMAYHRPWVLL